MRTSGAAGAAAAAAAVLRGGASGVTRQQRPWCARYHHGDPSSSSSSSSSSSLAAAAAAAACFTAAASRRPTATPSQTAAAAADPASMLMRSSPAQHTPPSVAMPPPPPPLRRCQRRPFSQLSPQPLLRADTSSSAPAASSTPSSSSSSADTTTTPPPPPPPPFSKAAETDDSATTPTTHYDLFPSTLPLGAPPAGPFPINASLLRREFLRLQARAHPDMHPPGAAKQRAARLSARINDAYRTLSSPLLRAQYLLALRGVDVAGDEGIVRGGTGGGGDHQPELLALVLEAREEIEDAESAADIEGLRRRNEDRIRAGEEALERAFREDDVEAARKEAVRMRYWVNIKESLDNWEPGRPVVLQH